MAESRYAEGPETVKIPQCYRCSRFLGDGRCRAFEKIPAEILNNFYDHRQPYPGDNGIQFEPIESPKDSQ